MRSYLSLNQIYHCEDLCLSCVPGPSGNSNSLQTFLELAFYLDVAHFQAALENLSIEDVTLTIMETNLCIF